MTALTTEELMLIEQRVTNAKKSTGAAYLLWFFFGIVSAHRFYLGRTGTAFLQIASYFVFVGFVWLLIDAFLIPGMIRESNDRERDRLISAMRSHKEADKTTALAGKIVALEGDDTFSFDIVGESHKQRELEALAGGRREHGADHQVQAILLPENNNRYDLNAVVVTISGEAVGYLDKANAKHWREVLFSTGPRAALVNAKIVGGWECPDGDVGHFGVKLDVTYPLTVVAVS